MKKECLMGKTLIFIGPINEGGAAIGGAVRKNQLLLCRFKEVFNKVITVDVINWTKRPWVLMRLFFVLLRHRKAKVVYSASSKHLISFLYYLPMNKNVFFWVLGGDLHLGVKSGRYNLKALSSLKKILVQGRSMVDELTALGLQNVQYIPNTKPIIFKPEICKKKTTDPYRFVFLSRIHSYKGVREIFEAASLLIQQGQGDRFIVDFYGVVDMGFQAEFEHLLSTCSNVTYKGFLDLTDDEGYRLLSTYDVMLFPTYFEGEGFPGVVLDANMAGLPIIATDWNLNREVIVENSTGVIIPIHNSDALAESMMRFMHGELNLTYMKQQCVTHVMQYDICNVLSEQFLKTINLL